MEQFPMDRRWKNVWAYIGPPQGFVLDDDGEHEGLSQGKTEFLIEVTYDGMLFYAKQIVLNEDMDLANVDVFKFMLDHMVEMIDGYMKENGR